MQWYRATAWENHTAKHCKDNLPTYPDIPEFAKKFKPQSGDYASLSTSKQLLPHEKEIMKQVQAANCFLGRTANHTCSPASQERGFEVECSGATGLHEAHEAHIRQGPIKSSKKIKILKPEHDE